MQYLYIVDGFATCSYSSCKCTLLKRFSRSGWKVKVMIILCAIMAEACISVVWCRGSVVGTNHLLDVLTRLRQVLSCLFCAPCKCTEVVTLLIPAPNLLFIILGDPDYLHNIEIFSIFSLLCAFAITLLHMHRSGSLLAFCPLLSSLLDSTTWWTILLWENDILVILFYVLIAEAGMSQLQRSKAWCHHSKFCYCWKVW